MSGGVIIDCVKVGRSPCPNAFRQHPCANSGRSADRQLSVLDNPVRYQLFCTADLSPLFYRSRNICSKSCPHSFRSATKPPIATHPSLYPWRSCPHFFRSATKPPIATHPPLSPWRKKFYCPTFNPSWTKVNYNNQLDCYR